MSLYRNGIAVALVISIVYQLFLKNLVWVTLGIGRELQPISDFPYKCRQIHDPRLQACEDMYLSEDTRQLFLACSDPASRSQWMPNVGRLNASGRALNDAIIAMDIDRPNGNSFHYRVLSTPGFQGVQEDGRLHLIGFTARETPRDIELLLVNARPVINPKTNKLENSPDMVIEWFKTEKKHKSSALIYGKTHRHPVIASPNNVAFTTAGGEEGFFITNDHGDAQSGLRHSLAPVIGNGNIAFCSSSGLNSKCHIVADGYHFPNGLIIDKTNPNRLYVPSAWSGGIHVFNTPGGPNKLEKVVFIDIPYPIDNLSQDKNGDIWAAAMPKALETLAAFEDPLNFIATTTVFRIRKNGDDFEVTKMLEDREKDVLPGASTVIHDVESGRLFLSGPTSPFISVCEKVK